MVNRNPIKPSIIVPRGFKVNHFPTIVYPFIKPKFGVKNYLMGYTMTNMDRSNRYSKDPDDETWDRVQNSNKVDTVGRALLPEDG